MYVAERSFVGVVRLSMKLRSPRTPGGNPLALFLSLLLALQAEGYLLKASTLPFLLVIMSLTGLCLTPVANKSISFLRP